MAQDLSTMENVSIDEAVKRLIEVDKSNGSKINKLENQIDEICRNLDDYRTQQLNSTRDEFQNMSERIQEIQLTTHTIQQETNKKLEEFKHHWDDMYTEMKGDMNVILSTLKEVRNPTDASVSRILNDEVRMEGIERKLDNEGKNTIFTPENTMGRPFRITTESDNPFPIRTFETSPQGEPNQQIIMSPALPFNQVKHSIIVPPASAAPAFYGKQTESPTQFLIRVQEYAESVHAWDLNTLVNGISQFLRDSALEWYCQLRLSHRRPNTWTQFTNLFLAQFNSPVRRAKQEQEWHECKQKEDETINEFLVRLRALWREQKPRETEADLVKHLFRRMRNDLLTTVGVSQNASLDEVIKEVQQTEDLLYRRAKGERLMKQIKIDKHTNDETSLNKRYNETYTPRKTPWSNRNYPPRAYQRRPREYHVGEVTHDHSSFNQIQTTAEPKTNQTIESYSCYTCGGYGHLARNCPSSYEMHRQEWNGLNSKNVRGALDDRTSYAPI